MKKQLSALFFFVLFSTVIQAQNITQFDFATAIEDRQPVGIDTAFTANVGTVFCFTRIEGADDTTQIAHVWYNKDEERARINLDVKSDDWRTWSSKSILESWTGRWRVMVEDNDGNVLSTKTFVIRDKENQ